MRYVLYPILYIAAVAIVLLFLAGAAPRGIERTREDAEQARCLREGQQGNRINPAVSGVDE